MLLYVFYTYVLYVSLDLLYMYLYVHWYSKCTVH